MSIGADLARALDPVAMAEDAGMTPDPWQMDVLRSTSPRILLNCSRQSGKSTVVSLLADHTAIYDPGLILLLSPTLRQSGELFRKCLATFNALGRPVPTDAETQLQLELANGARLIALPGKDGTVRGYSGAKLLIVDEASRVSDDLYRAVRPMLAVSGGRLVALSTPFGKRGWWFEEWMNGGEVWERYRIPATMCPRIAPAFLEEERRSLGEWWFEQEYLCEFREAIDSVFSHDAVMAALDDTVQPLWRD